MSGQSSPNVNPTHDGPLKPIDYLDWLSAQTGMLLHPDSVSAEHHVTRLCVSLCASSFMLHAARWTWFVWGEVDCVSWWPSLTQKFQKRSVPPPADHLYFPAKTCTKLDKQRKCRICRGVHANTHPRVHTPYEIWMWNIVSAKHKANQTGDKALQLQQLSGLLPSLQLLQGLCDRQNLERHQRSTLQGKLAN